MDDNGLGELQYGTLGAASYNPESGAWTFESPPVRTSPLLVIQRDFAVPNDALQDGREQPSARQESAADDLQSHRKRATVMADEIPDLSAALPLLQHIMSRDLSKISRQEAISHVPDGQMLAFGTARGSASFGGRAGRIICFARGCNKDELCIAHLVQTSAAVPLPSDYSGNHVQATVASSRFVPDKKSKWCCPSGRLLQIISSQTCEENYTLFAARSFGVVHVLKPKVQRGLVRERLVWDATTAQAVTVEPVVDLHIAACLDAPCADMSFNPWFQRQLLLVDLRGRFCIVEISSRKDRQMRYRWKTYLDGKVKEPFQKYVGSVRTGIRYHAMWVFDVNHFVIGGGRDIHLFNVKSPNSYEARRTLAHDLVDLQPSPFQASDFFVLTTITIERYRLFVASHGSLDVQKVSSWKHGLGTRGDDMKMTFLREDEDEDGSVVVYSQRAFLVAKFGLGKEVPGVTPRVQMLKPSALRFSKDLSMTTVPQRVADLYIHQIPVLKGNQIDESSARYGSFFQLFTFGEDETVAAFTAFQRSRSNDSNDYGALDEKSLRRPNTKKAQEEDDWLLADYESDNSGVDETSRKIEEFATLGPINVDPASRVKKHEGQPTISNEWVYNAFLQFTRQPRKDLLPTAREVLKFHQASALNVYPADSYSGLWSIHDLNLTSNLFQAASGAVVNNVWQTSDSINFKLRRIGMPKIDGLVWLNHNSPTLVALYNSLVRIWITGLPDQTPVRTRIRLEQLARSMAASIWLSTHKLESDESQAPATSPAINTSTAMPSRSAVEQPLGSFENLSLSQDQPSSSQPLPHDSLSQSTFIASSPTLAIRSAKSKEKRTSPNPPENALLHLSRYTDMSRPPERIDAVSNIVSHWATGADPRSYDYQAEVAAATGTINVAGSQMAADVYARQLRREARQKERSRQRDIKRQRLSQDPSSAIGFSSSAMPSSQGPSQGTTSSHARQAIRQSSHPMMQSSPMFASQQARGATTASPDRNMSSQDLQVASQVHPGRFGARTLPGALAMRSKGKRKAGF